VVPRLYPQGKDPGPPVITVRGQLVHTIAGKDDLHDPCVGPWDLNKFFKLKALRMGLTFRLRVVHTSSLPTLKRRNTPTFSSPRMLQ
jgi:hypothetical protein